MFMIIDLILSIFLEKNTKKTTLNSSKPSSQTEKDDTSKTKEGSHGKDKSLKDGIANNTKVTKSVILLTVDVCESCGHNLINTACDKYETRTKIDIIFEKTIEHYNAEVKTCEHCHTTVKAHIHKAISSKIFKIT